MSLVLFLASYFVIALILDFLGTMDIIAVQEEKEWKSALYTGLGSLLGDIALYFIITGSQPMLAITVYAMGASTGAVVGIKLKRWRRKNGQNNTQNRPKTRIRVRGIHLYRRRGF